MTGLNPRHLQALYHAGVAIDWKGLDRDYTRRKIGLPTYPFQRERFWIESDRGALSPQSSRRSVLPKDQHPLIGVPLSSPAIEGNVFETELSAQQPSYLKDPRDLRARHFFRCVLCRNGLGRGAPAVR